MQTERTALQQCGLCGLDAADEIIEALIGRMLLGSISKYFLKTNHIPGLTSKRFENILLSNIIQLKETEFSSKFLWMCSRFFFDG